MRYSHLDLVPLFPPLYGGSSVPNSVVSAHHTRDADGIVHLRSNTLVSPVTMRFAADETPYRILSPNVPKRRKTYRADDWEEHGAWTDTHAMQVGGLGTTRLASYNGRTYRDLLRPKPVSADAVPFNPFDLADALTFTARMAGGAFIRLDATGARVCLHDTARAFALDLPIGSDVLAVSPAAANWFAGAVRLFAAREGRVSGSVGNVGSRTLPVWRFTVTAPSGATVILDATSASADTDRTRVARIMADCAADARAFARVRLVGWPDRLKGSDLRDVVVDEDGVRLVDPSKADGKGRPVPVDAREGDGTVCVPYATLLAALRAAGDEATLLVGAQTSPLLVGSRDGRIHTAILPWIPTALWAH